MARRKYRVLRITGWFILSFLSLVLLITLLFYLGRSWILTRALDYLNEQQDGVVEVGQINLIPFMNFPDVSLQLKNVNYYETAPGTDTVVQEPILFLNEFYVTLDAVDLIRRDILISEASMKKGFIRLEIYPDSVSNLEYALGIRFGREKEQDSPTVFPSVKIDLDQLMLTDVLLMFDDRSRDNHAQVNVNRLESRFSYLPDQMEAGIQLDVEINYLKYLTYNVETPRNLFLESEVTFDPNLKKVELQPSLARISGLEMETWGSYTYLTEPQIDMAFRASNRGLDLLNYIFRGVLDLDEIEQIGSGSMYLNGTINGSLSNALPVLRINGGADRIGFRVKSIQKDVNDISFRIFGTNGGKLDLSEGILVVEGFTASFPEGSVNASMSANNFKEPEVNIEIDGELELEGLEEMLKSEKVTGLKGHMKLQGELEGVFKGGADAFQNEGGILRASLSNVDFDLHRDSSSRDSVRNLNGAFYMSGNKMGTDHLDLEYNGSRLDLRASTENLILYLLGMDRDVEASVSLASEVIHTESLLRDTSISKLLGDPVRGLHFNAGLRIDKKELDRFFKLDSIPYIELSVDSLGVELPVFAAISDLNTSMSVHADSIRFHYLRGNFGESDIDFAGLVINYNALATKDSASNLGVSFDLASDLIRAGDLFTWDNEFLLPEKYSTEFLDDFRLQGSMEIPVAGLLDDSAATDLNLYIDSLQWQLRYYPYMFEDFRLALRRKGEVLHIDQLEGTIGENNLILSATLQNFTDTVYENISGNLVLESDRLDLNELMNYQLPEALQETEVEVDTITKLPPRLDQIDYPDFRFSLDVGELSYGEYTLYGLNGTLRSSRQKILYMDSLATSTESGGRLEVNGQFNVANPDIYSLSAEFAMKDLNVNDLDFEMKSGDETYTLKENFQGLVTADGLAEIFITPDFKFDVSTSTALFDVRVFDGALINFTPMQAVAKYLDNKDLNHVQFDSLYNRFTLMDSRINIPLMIVESTIGQLLIEGEQGLDNSYLYLLRLPTWLVRGAARSRLTAGDAEQEESQIYEMRRGNFMTLTAWGDGEKSEVKLGDRRDRYRDQ